MRLSNLPLMLFYVAASTMVAAPFAYGMPANPFGSFQERQPDGTIVTLKVNGDAHDSWMVDQDEYTVLKDPATGYFVYAQPDGKGGLEPSLEIVRNQNLPNYGGQDDPMDGVYHQEGEDQKKMPPQFSTDSYSSPMEFDSESPFQESSQYTSFRKEKNIRPTKRDCHNKICGEHTENSQHGPRSRKRSLRGVNSDQLSSAGRPRALYGGKKRLRNLVLLLQWSDHSDRMLPTREDYEILMNNDGPHSLCPTGSVRDVFLQNSYGALEVDSYVTDWIPMNGTEAYYSNGDKGTTTYIHDALRYALAYVDDLTGEDSIDFDFFDEDHDGYIDSITFIHSGYAAENVGRDAYGRFYEDRIWSHKWSLYNQTFVSKKGRNVKVDSYHISSGVWGLRGSEIGRIGVVAHEMAHFLGLPDLYDYDSSSFGIGNYGLMANSWGANGQQRFPPHMSPLAKMVLGWINPIQPTRGINVIEASAEVNPSFPQFYIIEEGFPEGEFLMIENRQPRGYDVLLPQGGLAIWHIDFGDSGVYDMIDVFLGQSREGYPEQEGWPENGNHYSVALLQADGYYDLENKYNSGDYEDLFHADNVDELVPCRKKNDCQYPNTDSYQGGKIARSNVHIKNISASGNIMTFEYKVEDAISTDSPTFTPTFSPTFFPTVSPTIAPTTEDERTGRRAGRICRNDGQCTSGYCKKRWRWFFGMGWSFFGRCRLTDQ